MCGCGVWFDESVVNMCMQTSALRYMYRRYLFASTYQDYECADSQIIFIRAAEVIAIDLPIDNGHRWTQDPTCKGPS